MKDSVIIVSGGMDSITLLYDKKDEIALGISFNYGSNHNEREIPFSPRCTASDWASSISPSTWHLCISISRVRSWKVPMPSLRDIMPMTI